MADQTDMVQVPRKWITTLGTVMIGLLWMCIVEGYKWASALERHLESTDRTVWEQGKDIKDGCK